MNLTWKMSLNFSVREQTIKIAFLVCSYWSKRIDTRRSSIHIGFMRSKGFCPWNRYSKIFCEYCTACSNRNFRNSFEMLWRCFWIFCKFLFIFYRVFWYFFALFPHLSFKPLVNSRQDRIKVKGGRIFVLCLIILFFLLQGILKVFAIFLIRVTQGQKQAYHSMGQIFKFCFSKSIL